MKLAAALVLAAVLLPATAHATEPVVLVHGTFGDSTNWGYIKPQLEAEGYRTFAIDYGNRGTGDIARLRAAARGVRGRRAGRRPARRRSTSSATRRAA